MEVSWNTAGTQENTTWPDEGAGRGGGGKGVSFGNKIERAWILDLEVRLGHGLQNDPSFQLEQLVPFPEMGEDWAKTE